MSVQRTARIHESRRANVRTRSLETLRASSIGYAPSTETPPSREAVENMVEASRHVASVLQQRQGRTASSR
jgi:hypothetical protein